VLGTLRGLPLDRLFGAPRVGMLVRAMIVARLLEPASKLATAKALSHSTAGHSLAPVLRLGAVDENELYAALDWLLERQPAIEAALAKQHLTGGTLVPYDVSSSYLEGRHGELASFGHSRDDKPRKFQIVYGLLCAANGCPVAIEVFHGNTVDPKTLSGAGHQDQRALCPRPCRPGRGPSGHGLDPWGPRHDHPGAHRSGAAPRPTRLDHRSARATDPRSGRRRRAAAIAV
jgi:hypothetical protein